jgi:predicted RNA binding protein YcfA (HicA-like mRNA interferase family)
MSLPSIEWRELLKILQRIGFVPVDRKGAILCYNIKMEDLL